jgi:hypothetical protein
MLFPSRLEPPKMADRDALRGGHEVFIINSPGRELGLGR